MNAALTSEHPAVRRAVERMTRAARKDHVRRTGEAAYEVISGRTGRVYAVNTKLMTCECEAALRGRLCRHRVAALSFERALERTRIAPLAPPASSTVSPGCAAGAFLPDGVLVKPSAAADEFDNWII